MGWRDTTKSTKRLRLSARRLKRIPPRVHAAKRQRLQQVAQDNQAQPSTSSNLPAESSFTNTSCSAEEFDPIEASTPYNTKKNTSSYSHKRKVSASLIKWRLSKKKKIESVSMSSVSLPSVIDYNSSTSPQVSLTSHDNLISNQIGIIPNDSDTTSKENDLTTECIITPNGKEIGDQETNRQYHDLIIQPDGRPPRDKVEMISGRFIVDGKHFVQELRSLDNHRFECETNSNGYMELVSSNTKSLEWSLKFMCPYCQRTKIIHSEPREHASRKDNLPTSKLSLADQAVWGFTSIGSGHRNMEEVLSSMNVASISEKLFRKSEDRLGKVWQNVLYESMIQAGNEEKKLAIEEGNVTKNNIPFISVVVDGGWSHRSHGHRYSANSGVACVIGLKTKKLLHIDVRNKYCSMCKYLEKKGKPENHTNCYKNWDGSSCSMESDMIVNAFNASEKIHGIQYRRMIGDGDSSVHQKIRELVSYGRFVNKIECTNHLIKNYTKRLYKIRENGMAESRTLTQITIKRLKAAVKGAIIHHSKEKDINGLKGDLQNGPLHVLGCHRNCKAYFCKSIGSENELTDPQLSVIKKVLEALKPLLLRANSLWENQTSNLAENYMSLVAKFTGGKQVNRGKRGSFTVRTRAAALDFQYGPMWQYKTMKSALKRSPALLVKKTALRREKKLLSCRKSLMQKYSSTERNKKPRYVNQKIGTEDYGVNCKRIDLDVTEYEEEKEVLLKSLALSDDEKASLEIATRGQAENNRWHEERKLRVTASYFGLICKRLPKSKWAPVVRQILYSKVSTSAMLYGQLHESTAVNSFEQNFKTNVQSCGLFVDKKHDFLAASPDGLVGHDKIIEVKCPKSAENLTIDEAIIQSKSFCLENDKSSGTVRLKRNHNYYYQIQGQLQVADKNSCYFVVWTKRDIHIETILRDEMFWKIKMESKLCYFYHCALLPEIVDPRSCRSMPIREPAISLEQFV